MASFIGLDDLQFLDLTYMHDGMVTHKQLNPSSTGGTNVYKKVDYYKHCRISLSLGQ